MPFENLLVSSSRSIGGIQLDAILSESHTNVIRKTTNPVELGADITDHAIIEPKIINIQAQVSDTPINGAAFGQIVDLVTGLFGSSTSSNITRSNASYNAMVQLAEAREPIDVQTRLRLYSNMIITNISTTQDKDSSRVALMDITMEEILITNSTIVFIDSSQLRSGRTSQQASSSDNRGRVEPTVPDDATNTSVLRTVIDWVEQ